MEQERRKERVTAGWNARPGLTGEPEPQCWWKRRVARSNSAGQQHVGVPLLHAHLVNDDGLALTVSTHGSGLSSVGHRRLRRTGAGKRQRYGRRLAPSNERQGVRPRVVEAPNLSGAVVQQQVGDAEKDAQDVTVEAIGEHGATGREQPASARESSASQLLPDARTRAIQCADDVGVAQDMTDREPT